jgi:hypothetical protein
MAGMKKAWADRRRRKRLGELRYHVANGQDAAAPLAAVRRHGFDSRISMDGGYEDIVIVCDPVEDRERVRAILREAPRGMSGVVEEGAPIRFVDEVSPA